MQWMTAGFLLAAALFWMLAFRIVATIVKLDPYHPVTQFLFRFTNFYVRPFRIGPLKRPAKVDLAVIPPLVILLIAIIGFLQAM